MELAEAKIAPWGNNVVAMASHGTDRNLAVEFFIQDVYQPYASEKAGRAIYKPVEMARLYAVGAKSDIIKIVTHEDLPNEPSLPHRFPRQYEAFKKQQEQVPDGTPLEMCKFLPSHRVKELKFSNIHTAEQLAATPDSTIQTLGMGAFRERELCKTFLANDDQKVKQVSNLLAENTAMKADIEAMKAQFAELNSRMANQMANDGKIYQSTLQATEQTEQKRGPGRPRKEQNNGDQV